MVHILEAISPVDGKYHEKVSDFEYYFSEAALIKTEVLVELHWLKVLLRHKGIANISLTKQEQLFLDSIVNNFSLDDACQVKTLEAMTEHDLKAVEYFLRERVKGTTLFALGADHFIHFACTSEDIKNIAFGIILRSARFNLINPVIQDLINSLKMLASWNADIAMLSRTHGQPATPTTLGKEFAVFGHRVERQYQQLREAKLLGKLNGASGNFNAHLFAYPDIDWVLISKNFVRYFDLEWNPYTTQIESHDCLAELFSVIARLNTILIGFCRDMWGYISLGYFRQNNIGFSVAGSSTMPHKVNPIHFEQAEGNLGLANSQFNHFIEKLPISRWQRDLSDSTVLRNMGVPIAQSVIAYKAILKGLSLLDINKEVIAEDLNNAWEVLAEPMQTILRKNRVENAYEMVRDFVRGRRWDRGEYITIVESLPLPLEEKDRLKALTPSTYTGNAKEQAEEYSGKIGRDFS